jgi:hypothetical protein
VVDVEACEDLARRSSGAQPLSRPAVERGAMCAARLLEVANGRRGAAGEDGATPTQPGGDCRGKLVPLLDARPLRRTLLVERPLGEIDNLLDLRYELDKRTVAAGRTRRAHAGVRVLAADRRHRRARRLRVSGDQFVRGITAHCCDEVCHGDARLGGPLAQ